MSEPTPQPPMAGDARERSSSISEEDLLAVFQAMDILKDNRQKVIRTADLDAQKQQCTQVVNEFLSRHAFDAIEAMRFMFMIVPSQLAQISHILAAHKFTYLPVVDTLNRIAAERKMAAAAAKKGLDNGTEELRG